MANVDKLSVESLKFAVINEVETKRLLTTSRYALYVESIPVKSMFADEEAVTVDI